MRDVRTALRHRVLPRLGRVAVRFGATVAAFVVLGNVALIGMSVGARLTMDGEHPDLPGISHLRVVDDRLWRGDAPSAGGYRALAQAGVTTVVDLRPDDAEPEAAVRELGLRHVHLPIPDGHAPSAETVDRFLEVVETSPGLVYVHCSAGVGRTGTMVAAYLTRTGTDATDALHHNLSVGPSSLEQVAFVLDAVPDGEVGRPPAVVAVASRLIDAPRRVYTLLRHGF